MQLQDFLCGQDVAGLAAELYGQSVNGQDFLELSREQELRLSPFGARKLVQTRERFLVC